jgi:hypothetical protein
MPAIAITAVPITGGARLRTRAAARIVRIKMGNPRENPIKAGSLARAMVRSTMGAVQNSRGRVPIKAGGQNTRGKRGFTQALQTPLRLARKGLTIFSPKERSGEPAQYRYGLVRRNNAGRARCRKKAI